MTIGRCRVASKRPTTTSTTSDSARTVVHAVRTNVSNVDKILIAPGPLSQDPTLRILAAELSSRRGCYPSSNCAGRCKRLRFRHDSGSHSSAREGDFQFSRLARLYIHVFFQLARDSKTRSEKRRCIKGRVHSRRISGLLVCLNGSIQQSPACPADCTARRLQFEAVEDDCTAGSIHMSAVLPVKNRRHTDLQIDLLTPIWMVNWPRSVEYSLIVLRCFAKRLFASIREYSNDRV